MHGPAEVRALLARHAIAPHRTYGQNFVVDANTVRKVARDAVVAPGDLVVEIGPGLGSLTLALREAGAQVLAIEIDAGMVRALSEVVGDDPDVTVLHADALQVDYADLLQGRAAKLVANLPYNTATPLLMGALHSGAFMQMLLMVQREAGERWTASVGHRLYGAVSVKVAALAAARIVAPVSRNAFYPVPNVDSVTVGLVPAVVPLAISPQRLFPLVEAGFSQRRKRLRNALATAGWDPPAVEAALSRAGMDPGARAEELSLQRWVALAEVLR